MLRVVWAVDVVEDFVFFRAVSSVAQLENSFDNRIVNPKAKPSVGTPILKKSQLFHDCGEQLFPRKIGHPCLFIGLKTLYQNENRSHSGA